MVLILCRPHQSSSSITPPPPKKREEIMIVFWLSVKINWAISFITTSKSNKNLFTSFPVRLKIKINWTFMVLILCHPFQSSSSITPSPKTGEKSWSYFEYQWKLTQPSVLSPQVNQKAIKAIKICSHLFPRYCFNLSKIEWGGSTYLETFFLSVA